MSVRRNKTGICAEGAGGDGEICVCVMFACPETLDFSWLNVCPIAGNVGGHVRRVADL